MPSAPGLCFGPYRLEGPYGPLWRRTQRLTVPSKALAVLWALASQAGQVITRAELLDTVWPGIVVSEGVLTACVRDIRKFLNDDHTAPRYIETVHRMGYRFIEKVVSSQYPVASRKEQSRIQGLGPRVPKEQAEPSPNPQSPALNLVGREAELARLYQQWEKALAGERQVVFVTGEAGIGKTTLVETFLAQVERTDVLWIGRGQCIEHSGAGEAYLPVLEALGRLCHQLDGGRCVAVLRQYAPSWLVQLPGLLSPAALAALQRRVSGTTRERMLRELAEALEALASEHLVVLVLEDLFWSDVSTLEVLAVLARRRETARLFIIGTYRPVELIVHDHPLKVLKQELAAHGKCVEVALGYLSPAAVRAYVVQRFAQQRESEALAAFLYRRTEGHPLFMVQMADYMEQQRFLPVFIPPEGRATDEAAVELAVPPGLRELIEVQVGRLSAEAQRVLEVGSVSGAEFTVASVAAGLQTTPDALEEVCERLALQEQFIEDRALTEWPDGTVSGRYGFRHTLYQEVLYQRIGSGRRAQLHRAIGMREEIGYGERASEIATTLAVHFERGRDYQRAVLYHTVAAQHAIRVHAHREALTHITSGLVLIPHIPDRSVRAQRELVLQTMRGVSLTSTQGFGLPEVEDAYRRGYDLSLEVADLPALAPILFGLWSFWVARADLGRAGELAQQLGTLAQKQVESALRVTAHTIAGQTHGFLGNLTAAFSQFAQGLALYNIEQHGLLVYQYGEDAGASSHNVMAQICWLLGFPDQARQHLAAGRQLAQRLAHPFLLAQNLWRSLIVLQCCGAISDMAEHIQTLLRVCEAEAIPVWLAGGVILQGWTAAQQGQGERGIALMQEGLQEWRATGCELIRPYYLALLAEAYGSQGQIETGLNSLGEALQLVASTGERWWEAELYRLKGELMLQKFHISSSKSQVQNLKTRNQKLATRNRSVGLNPQAEAEAEACFLKAIDIACQQEAKSLELRAVMSLVRLRQLQASHHAARPSLDEAHTMLSELYGWFTEGFDTADLQEAKVLLEKLRH